MANRSPSQRLARATRTSLGEESTLLERRQVLPGRIRLTLEARALAAAVQPGQFVYVLEPRHPGLLLPAVPVAGFDRVAGRVTLLLDDRPGPASALLHLRAGDAIRLAGPLGRGLELSPRGRFLLVVADQDGFARVGAAIDEAVATGRQVTVLAGARSVADVLPSSLLPDEAEYVVATQDGSLGHRGDVTDLVTQYEAWADQCFAAGSGALVRRMTTLAMGRDERLGVARLGRRRSRRSATGRTETGRRAWLQVVMPHEAGCALGVCLGCVVDGTDGPLRVCREGPAFGVAQLRQDRGA